MPGQSEHHAGDGGRGGSLSSRSESQDGMMAFKEQHPTGTWTGSTSLDDARMRRTLTGGKVEVTERSSAVEE